MADFKGSSGFGATSTAHKGGSSAPQGQQGAASIGDKVRDTAVDAWHKTEDLASSAAGKVKDAAQGVACAAEHAYDATTEKAGELADSLTSLIRRNPLPAVLVGLGLGCMVGMLMSRRS